MEKHKRFTKKNKAFYCECGGQIMYDRIGYRKIPLGFGFAERKSGPGFGIDYKRQDLIEGCCLSCGHEGTFYGKIHKTLHTKRIRRVTEALKANNLI